MHLAALGVELPVACTPWLCLWYQGTLLVSACMRLRPDRRLAPMGRWSGVADALPYRNPPGAVEKRVLALAAHRPRRQRPRVRPFDRAPWCFHSWAPPRPRFTPPTALHLPCGLYGHARMVVHCALLPAVLMGDLPVHFHYRELLPTRTGTHELSPWRPLPTPYHKPCCVLPVGEGMCVVWEG